MACKGKGCFRCQGMSLRMYKHIESLGFEQAEAYYDWCRTKGFQPSPNKNLAQLQDEHRARELERQKRGELLAIARNPVRLIRAACAGEISAHELPMESLRSFVVAIGCSGTAHPSRSSLEELLLCVLKRGDFLFEEATVDSTLTPTFLDSSH